MSSRHAPYRIAGGRIHTEACEINVVDHCNLRCRGCSHLSPAMSRAFVDPDAVRRDLTTLARAYSPDHVRLVGGEPLLHPDIDAVLAAVRASGITERIRVITNGTLLHRMPETFWSYVDEVHVSAYPGRHPAEDRLAIARVIAAEHGVQLVIKRFDRFRESYTERGTSDPLLVQRIYDTCQIAHVWRCHTVADGVFYRCPQSLYLARLSGRSQDATLDGLAIETDDDFASRLLAHLSRRDPLRACSRCLGSVGRPFAHEQVPRGAWRALQVSATEDGLDWVKLTALEATPDAAPDCSVTLVG